MKAGELIDDMAAPKASSLSVRKEVKKQKEHNINNMNSVAITWHLTYKHRVGLLILTNLALIAYLILSR